MVHVHTLIMKLLLILSFAGASLALESLRFMALGDWGGLPMYPYDTPIETSVAKQMASVAQLYNPDFILALGDNFYFNGVTNVTDKRFKDTYEDVYDYSELQVPWYLIAGNHDHYGNVSAQIAYSNVSSRWAEYLVVAGHYPVYSIAEHGSTDLLVARLDPLLYKYNVTAYLCGHDHNMQYLQTQQSGRMMDYFVIGAGNFCVDSKKNKHTVPAGSSKFFWAELKNLGAFGHMEVTADNMTVSYVDGVRQTILQHVLHPRS